MSSCSLRRGFMIFGWTRALKCASRHAGVPAALQCSTNENAAMRIRRDMCFCEGCRDRTLRWNAFHHGKRRGRLPAVRRKSRRLAPQGLQLRPDAATLTYAQLRATRDP
jgi:hypothetical protein